ncbi:TetR family transcriptional regulator C-terminal domain-containing protein [Streptomyces sp. NPDC047525]|uniref:TetR/AcrR family transcriptional regulator n=1 Tax=Streptomyces sp. NPDC047525 TaxID=3155264 RepID=UPI0034021D06
MSVHRRSAGPPRSELIADTALALLAERGMRGLTHRAVDEAAGLPQGSTSNHARTRLALLEAAVGRLAVRESAVLTPAELQTLTTPDKSNREPLITALALALHRYLTGDHRHLLVSRYELALEATRRPELRAYYDAAGARFREPLVALMRTMGSPDPERHALSLAAWCEGLLFSHAAGSFGTPPPSEESLRTGFRELLAGMLNEP